MLSFQQADFFFISLYDHDKNVSISYFDLMLVIKEFSFSLLSHPLKNYTFDTNSEYQQVKCLCYGPT